MIFYYVAHINSIKKTNFELYLILHIYWVTELKQIVIIRFHNHATVKMFHNIVKEYPAPISDTEVEYNTIIDHIVIIHYNTC